MRAANLIGKIHTHYDEAGRLIIEACDFKGNVTEQVRQVIADDAVLAAFAAPPAGWEVLPFHVDWQPPTNTAIDDLAASLLEPQEYRTLTTADALNRVTDILYPRASDGVRKRVTAEYNRAGLLRGVALDGAVFIERIAYNARGQRSLVVLGNDLMIRYAYEPLTFRLLRQRTERYVTSGALTYNPTGPPLQDFICRHDVAGNLLGIEDRTPGSGVPNTVAGVDALNRLFQYDPLYRLVTATGRECAVPRPSPWSDEPQCTDHTLTREYVEHYAYDGAGNLVLLQHQASSASFTRSLVMAPESNQLTLVQTGQDEFHYSTDDRGNIVRENTERHYEWDHFGRLSAFRIQTNDAEPSVYTMYLYDASGHRLKKVVRKQGGVVDSTVNIGGLFEHARSRQGGAIQENTVLHVMDGTRRLAEVRIGPPLDGDTTPSVKYHIEDHLRGSGLIVDGQGHLISREEYTPYGETSFGSVARKRYRWCGKERDGESGLYYFGARYYAPWLARWLSCDPAGLVDGPSLYAYARCNPLRYVDPAGTECVLNEEERVCTNQEALATTNATQAEMQEPPPENPLDFYAAPPAPAAPAPVEPTLPEPSHELRLYKGPFVQAQEELQAIADKTSGLEWAVAHVCKLVVSGPAFYEDLPNTLDKFETAGELIGRATLQEDAGAAVADVFSAGGELLAGVESVAFVAKPVAAGASAVVKIPEVAKFINDDRGTLGFGARVSAAAQTRPTFWNRTIVEVWERAKGADGLVRDPNTGEVLEFLEMTPDGRVVRPWHMGHKPDHEWRLLQRTATEKGWTRERVVREYNNPDHYRPESGYENATHDWEGGGW